MPTADTVALVGGSAGVISSLALVLKTMLERKVNSSLATKNDSEAQSALLQAAHTALWQPMTQELARMRAQVDAIEMKISEHMEWDNTVLRILVDNGLLGGGVGSPPPLR